MARILKTSVARADYREIYDYVFESSPQNAERLLRRFDARLDVLALNNMMGRRRPELAPTLRSFPESNYVIFYRPIEDGI